MPKQLNPTWVAEVLVAAAAGKDSEVAAQYGISTSSLRRYRRRTAQGKYPDVSVMVAKLQDMALEGRRDRLQETYDKFLDKANELVEDCTKAELVPVLDGLKIIGDLKLTRTALVGDESSSDKQSETASKVTYRQNAAGLRAIK